MNAHQTRITRRKVARQFPLQSVVLRGATIARVVAVGIKSLTVKRRDNRTVEWPVAEVSVGVGVGVGV